MGTGVQQIRNHYGRHISGDAFIRELTKFKSKTGKKTEETSVRNLMKMVQSGTIDTEVELHQYKKSGGFELTVTMKLGIGSRASDFL